MVKNTLRLNDGRRFGTLISPRSGSQHGFKFIDSLLALQKKGFRLVDAQELTDLTAHPDFPLMASKQKYVGDETYASNGWVYLPNGDMLVTTREANPVIGRYNKWVNSFTPDSFPDSEKYQQVLRDAISSSEDNRTKLILSSPGREAPSVLQRYHFMRDPEGMFAMLKPLLEYGRQNGIGILFPMNFNGELFHSAEETQPKEGEPYFISRIKNASRVYGFGGNMCYGELSQGELEKLVGASTEDPDKARQTGVLLVRRGTLNEELRKDRDFRSDKEYVIGSKVVYTPEAVTQEPIPRFLFGESAEQVAEQLRGAEKNLRVHLTYMEKLKDVKVGVPVALKAYHQKKAFDTEHFSMGGNDYIPIQAQIFGVK